MGPICINWILRMRRIQLPKRTEQTDKIVLENFPARTVVGGFSHSYCKVQVTQPNAMAKRLNCVIENPKVGASVSIFLRN